MAAVATETKVPMVLRYSAAARDRAGRRGTRTPSASGVQTGLGSHVTEGWGSVVELVKTKEGLPPGQVGVGWGRCKHRLLQGYSVSLPCLFTTQILFSSRLLPRSNSRKGSEGRHCVPRLECRGWYGDRSRWFPLELNPRGLLPGNIVGDWRNTVSTPVYIHRILQERDTTIHAGRS